MIAAVFEWIDSVPVPWYLWAPMLLSVAVAIAVALAEKWGPR